MEAGPHIRARSGEPTYTSTEQTTGPAPKQGTAGPEWLDGGRMPAARAKAEPPDGRLDRDKTHNTPRKTQIIHSPIRVGHHT